MDIKDLYKWCKILPGKLEGHPDLKIPFRMVSDSLEMGELMAREFVDEIKAACREKGSIRVIVPCGPKCWYPVFARIVNTEKVSLRNMTVFHMDECLNWEGKLLPAHHPYNFRAFMERHFYGDILPGLQVPPAQRYFPSPPAIDTIRQRISEAPVDLLLGGWGQDGHVAYNQARRHPYSNLSLEQLRNSEIRIQDNNPDTLIALGHRTFGGAYQFVPPMSVTLGMKECLSARKIRLFSDTGAWKQTALRVALFSPETVEYPITLLQHHPDVLITATRETASHPIADNPDWEFEGIHI